MEQRRNRAASMFQCQYLTSLHLSCTSLVMHPVDFVGKWKDDGTRALLWRLLLNVIPRDSPPSRWGREMSRKRDEYRRLKADHRVDISKVSCIQGGQAGSMVPSAFSTHGLHSWCFELSIESSFSSDSRSSRAIVGLHHTTREMYAHLVTVTFPSRCERC